MAEGNVLAVPGAGPAPARELGRSVPVGLEIPAIGVRTDVVPIGLRPDRALEAPAPAAGWFHQSPAPGEPGAAVIAGPADSDDGPAVFHQLRLLRPGDEILVRRGDGLTVCFAVTAVGLYPRDAFPGDLVHGPREHPELTLVTRSSAYAANVVVFARGTA
jgi:sortase (surface protein transpeptidase)